MATEEKPTEKKEECKACKIAVALGMALNICKDIEGKEICDDLYQKITQEEITPKELFETLKKKANKEQLNLLDCIKELAGPLEVDDNES